MADMLRKHDILQAMSGLRNFPLLASHVTYTFH